jgi:hypothetical protein
MMWQAVTKHLLLLEAAKVFRGWLNEFALSKFC